MINFGIFTKNMCKRALKLYTESFAARDLKAILVEAVKKTPEKGSCTAVMASLEDETLKTINLGDSGYIIYSDKKQVYRTTEQQHYFNCPFQCGNQNKEAEKAEENQHTVKHNDVIMMGTDGVFDNLDDDQIFVNCIEPRYLESGDMDDLQGAATCIATHAEVYSYDNTYLSPF